MPLVEAQLADVSKQDVAAMVIAAQTIYAAWPLAQG